MQKMFSVICNIEYNITILLLFKHQLTIWMEEQ